LLSISPQQQFSVLKKLVPRRSDRPNYDFRIHHHQFFMTAL
jgi:hypothetical protein